MKSIRAIAFLVVAVLSTTVLAQDAAPTKEQRVRELLTLMRAGDMGVQVIDQMIAAMKESVPQAPEEFWTKFRSKVKATELVDLLVPVYANNLEAADIEELIRFYSSPAGQRFLSKQPVILQESMKIGQTWGEKIATQAIEELQKAQQE